MSEDNPFDDRLDEALAQLVEGKCDTKDKTWRAKYILPLIKRQDLLSLVISDSGNWDVLAFSGLENNNEGTGLHAAVNMDTILPRKKKLKPTAFTEFICDLMKSGIADERLGRDKAAEILSKTDKNGATCLHLALVKGDDRFKASKVVDDLIEMADHRTFTQRRENGNTPLHDAVDFRLRVEDASLGGFLIQAPRRDTPAFRTPLADFHELTAEPTRIPGCCERCLDINKEYHDHKKRHASILCALLKKGPAASSIANNAGQSPYPYHVLARDAYRQACQDVDKRVNDRKQQQRARQNSSPRSNINLDKVSTNVKDDKVSTSVKDIDKSPNRKLATPPTWGWRCIWGCWWEREHDCGLSARGLLRFFQLSACVEELLWQAAFNDGIYEVAYQCLFPAIVAPEPGQAKDESPPDRHDLYRIFKPNRSVTASTRKKYRNFKFLPTMASVHLRVTPDHDLGKHQKPLAEKKGVGRILKLVVEDNPSFPCSEATVQACFSRLREVRYLDWRRPNISAQAPNKAPNLVEVWLYSTGINAVLAGWADKGGLQTLKMLRTVHLDAKQGIETKAANDNNVNSFEKQLARWYQTTERKAPLIKLSVETKGASARGTTYPGSVDCNDQPLNPWLEKVKRLAGQLQPQNAKDQGSNSDSDSDTDEVNETNDAEESGLVKVALIDDGVDPEWDGSGGPGDFLDDAETASGEKAWPSACQETFSIGAAHISLGKKSLVGRKAQFFFPSQDVLDDVVDSGTSAATVHVFEGCRNIPRCFHGHRHLSDAGLTSLAQPVR
ncbi:hypothetical protein B0T26DRAFT_871811 [Lasiosphaeria miniovina]|uniref:Ankyrin repeat protein n=1 Tax=Lasiosphaeria miniovina TaxID=1954250 RepID=A0AA40DUW3_9PEZI|nr:uncharacterized protein B0T26DRAFT_871811 [Lasiosphaeria miniovina]KAK0717289.1 hypothetical protein B0T26DRAFT_871811 [Lasiosphaeria miniovina]